MNRLSDILKVAELKMSELGLEPGSTRSGSVPHVHFAPRVHFAPQSSGFLACGRASCRTSHIPGSA